MPGYSTEHVVRANTKRGNAFAVEDPDSIEGAIAGVIFTPVSLVVTPASSLVTIASSFLMTTPGEITTVSAEVIIASVEVTTTSAEVITANAAGRNASPFLPIAVVVVAIAFPISGNL